MPAIVTAPGDTVGSRTVAITGANGLIGTLLTKHFLASGWNVHALQRSEAGTAGARLTRFPYRLGHALDDRCLEHVDALIHCAVQQYDRKNRDADDVNLAGARALLDVCHRKGVRVVFLSSFAAHPRALSHYGRTKLAIEALCDPSKDLVIRPGLVLAEGGLFSSLVGIVKKSRVIPLIDNGKQPIQTVFGDDLCRCIETAVQKRLAGSLNVATPEVSTMKALHVCIAQELGLRRTFVPVPFWTIDWIIRMAEMLAIPIGVSWESALGLKRMEALETRDDLAQIGADLLPSREAIARLVRAHPRP